MKIGICICTYNRPDYLRQTLESLAKAELMDSHVLIVDDCSRSGETIRLISGYRRIVNKQNLSIRHSLQRGFDQLIKDGCDVLINLDSDVIVHHNFLVRLIRLHEQFPNNIVSGFNTLTKAKNGKPRHPVIARGNGYVTKHSIGGVNMVMSVGVYEQIVRPALVESRVGKGQWDKLACHNSVEAGKDIIVTSPSVMQHIGFNSAMRHTDNPDVADDFKEQLCVLQPHGLGDVIFCQTLVRELGDYEITWPVAPQFIPGLERAYPDINWVADSPVPLSIKREGVYNGYRVLPIRWSDQIRNVPYKYVMKAKYDMCKKNWRTWKSKAMWRRDYEREERLFKLLGLEGKEYVLKNMTFLSSGSGRVEIGVKGIEMRQIEGFSLFDWAKVLENAREIHTVSTSVLYLLDLLETGPVHVYVRAPNEKDHSFYDYIFTGSKFIYR